jgi:hypothetical protein
MKKRVEYHHQKWWGKIPRAVLVLATLLLGAANGQKVLRGRDEATLSVPASNVMGNGNIDIFAASDARYSVSGFGFDPIIGGQIGISDIMQLNGQFIPISKSALGPVEAHLKITSPDNDNLRFFGAAFSADLYLSSTADTMSQTAQTNKPEYNPYLAASIIADLDWLALWKLLPIKTYLYLGMVDNASMLVKYDQVALRAGLEWKMFRNGAFACIGAGFYKGKSSRTQPADASYAQNYVWIEPGARYRLFSRLSLVGSVKLALFETAKAVDPFQPELFKITIRAEAPILFKETNTEAIRTLVFMERKKEKTDDSLEKKVATGKNIISGMSASLIGGADSLETSDVDMKTARIKRREETQKKMDEVEDLFKSLDVEGQLKEPPRPDSAETRKKGAP